MTKELHFKRGLLKKRPKLCLYCEYFDGETEFCRILGYKPNAFYGCPAFKQKYKEKPTPSPNRSKKNNTGSVILPVIIGGQ